MHQMRPFANSFIYYAEDFSEPLLFQVLHPKLITPVEL